MATIQERKLSDGSSSYRVLIRRKGIPQLSITFTTFEEAQEWTRMNEEEYIKNPERYDWINKMRLTMSRQREFFRMNEK